MANNKTKVLVLDINGLGDHLYNLSLALSYRKATNGEITLVRTSSVRPSPFPEMYGFRSIEISGPWRVLGWWKKPHLVWRSICDLRGSLAGQYDRFVVIGPTGSLIETLLGKSLQKSKYYCYTSKPSRSLKYKALGWHNEHIYISRNNFLKSLLFDHSTASPAWPLPGYERTSPVDTGMLLLCPEASMPGKQWPSASWLKLASAVAGVGYKVTFVETPKGTKSALAPREHFPSWRGKISDLISLMRDSKAVVSVDSFAGHLASAVGVPVFSIFGPTNPDHWAPWGEANCAIRAEGAAIPKFTRSAIETQGPRLMASLDPAVVAERLLAWLRSASSKLDSSRAVLEGQTKWTMQAENNVCSGRESSAL